MTFSFGRTPAFSTLRLVVASLLVIGMTAAFGSFIHLRSEKVVAEQLHEHLLSIVSIAALTIDAKQVESIHGLNEDQTESYHSLVAQLKHIRTLIPHVRFAYIMRRTQNPMELSFVADADALSTIEELDTNKNGHVDADEEAGLPGDIYPVLDVPALQKDAFIHPLVEEEMLIDQWGSLLSAYAPILNEQGEAIAVLGIDIQADVFFDVTQNIFSMFAVVIVTFIGVLLAVYIVFVIHARHLESLQQLNTERTALLDLATHQLGMPLATFRWWLELLKERDHGKFCKRDDVCDQLQEGIDRMDSIISSLHQAGSMQESTFVGVNEQCALPSVAKTVLMDMKKQLQLKKQTVQTHIEAHLPMIHMNAKICNGMVRELLENASDYSPHHTVITMTVRAVRGGVELKVSDHGYGIPKQDLPHIFEQFKRGSNATKYKPVGNGLGLYIVQRIIQRSRGTIRVESTLDSGTTFTIFLPRA